MITFREKFYNRAKRDGNGCMVWQGAIQTRGYGAVWYDGKVHLAHRVSFLLANGRWPEPKLVIDHTCNNKACVNPGHLRELDGADNVRRAFPMDPARAQARIYEARSRANRRG